MDAKHHQQKLLSFQDLYLLPLSGSTAAHQLRMSSQHAKERIVQSAVELAACCGKDLWLGILLRHAQSLAISTPLQAKQKAGLVHAKFQ